MSAGTVKQSWQKRNAVFRIPEIIPFAPVARKQLLYVNKFFAGDDPFVPSSGNDPGLTGRTLIPVHGGSRPGVPQQTGFLIQLLRVDTYLTAQIVKVLISRFVCDAVYRIHQNIPNPGNIELPAAARPDAACHKIPQHLRQGSFFHKISENKLCKVNLIRILGQAVHGFFL